MKLDSRTALWKREKYGDECVKVVPRYRGFAKCAPIKWGMAHTGVKRKIDGW